MGKSKKKDKRRIRIENPVAKELRKFKGRRFDKREVAFKRLERPTFITITRYASADDSRK